MPRKKVIYDHEGGKPWQNFLDRLSNFTCNKKNEITSIEDYDEVQIMGYFIDQVKKHLNQDFTKYITYDKNDLSINREALRHPQMRTLRQIIVALNQMDENDPYYDKIKLMPNKNQWSRAKVIAFIDWSIKRISKKVTITRLKYISDNKYISAFLSQYGTKERSEELPEQLKKIVPTYINTFGDLAFYSQVNTLDALVINELHNLGVDLSKVI